MSFNDKQIEQLLRPIKPERVLRDGKGNSHVSQQDVTAHLIRVFGFGNFDTQVLDVQCVFERQREKDGKPVDRYDVCYRALVRLIVKDEHGAPVCSYEDGSTATAQNQTLGDAHDLAYKSALSLSKKRAAINLGDQFGLSLYNKGQMAALVKGSLVGAEHEAGKDLQEGVDQQVSLGNDEVDYEPTEAPDPELANDFLAMIETATTRAELEKVGADLAKSTVPSAQRASLRDKYTQRMGQLAA